MLQLILYFPVCPIIDLKWGSDNLFFRFPVIVFFSRPISFPFIIFKINNCDRKNMANKIYCSSCFYNLHDLSSLLYSLILYLSFSLFLICFPYFCPAYLINKPNEPICFKDIVQFKIHYHTACAMPMLQMKVLTNNCLILNL